METVLAACRPIRRRITISQLGVHRTLRPDGGGTGARVAGFSEEVGQSSITVGGFYDGVSSKDAANFSARLGIAMFGLGTAPAWLAAGERGRCPQRTQESSGGDFPARRGGRPERGGPVRRQAYYDLRPTIAIPAPKAGSAGPARIPPSIWTASSACIPRSRRSSRFTIASHLAIVHAVGSPDPDALALRRAGLHGIGHAGPQGDDRWLAESRAAAGNRGSMSPVRAVSLGTAAAAGSARSQRSRRHQQSERFQGARRRGFQPLRSMYDHFLRSPC